MSSIFPTDCIKSPLISQMENKTMKEERFYFENTKICMQSSVNSKPSQLKLESSRYLTSMSISKDTI